MNLRGVLFDLDGTLIDHESAVTAGLAGWLPELGRTADAAELARWTALQEPHLAAWREGRVTFAEQRRRRVRAFLDTDGTDADLDALFAGYLRHYERAWRAYDDVAGALAAVAAAGLAVAVLTNGSRSQQLKKLTRTGLGGRVGPVFTIDDLGTGKPDPAAFHRTCERWGLTPATVLSVGDDHAKDVVAARAAGLTAVHLDRLGRGPVDEPDRITSLAGLADRLSGGARPPAGPAT